VVFMQIMTTVHDGLQSSDATISAYCANTIDHMASYYFANKGKDKIEMHNLNKVSLIWGEGGNYFNLAHKS
jgi:exportin-7